MKEKLAKLRADLRKQKTDISDMETKPKGLTKFLLEKSQEDHQELQLLIESIQESVGPSVGYPSRSQRCLRLC